MQPRGVRSRSLLDTSKENTMSKRTRIQLTAIAGAAALAVLGVAYAQSAGQADAPAELQAAPQTMVVQTESAPGAEAAAAAAMPAPQSEPTVQVQLPQRIEVIAEPAFVAPPPGLTAPLDRAGVAAEFETMRAADVLVPSGEAGDTVETAERRNAFHQGEAVRWVSYQERLAEVRLANQRAREQQVALEQQVNEARMQAAQPAQTPGTGAVN
jgi:hypothetical protein